MITIVDTGTANVESVRNMLSRIGAEVRVARSAAEVADARKLILPGVGAFDPAMESLSTRGLIDPLLRAVREEGAALLGICLGMQLLLEGSDEGRLPGLGLIRGRARSFRRDTDLRVPHMGWNTVRWARETPLRPAVTDGERYYFVHSYFADCVDPTDAIGITDYGGEFASVLQRGRVFGAQFHPEKSHRYGMALLRGYSSL